MDWAADFAAANARRALVVLPNTSTTSKPPPPTTRRAPTTSSGGRATTNDDHDDFDFQVDWAADFTARNAQRSPVILPNISTTSGPPPRTTRRAPTTPSGKRVPPGDSNDDFVCFTSFEEHYASLPVYRLPSANKVEKSMPPLETTTRSTKRQKHEHRIDELNTQYDVKSVGHEIPPFTGGEIVDDSNIHDFTFLVSIDGKDYKMSTDTLHHHTRVTRITADEFAAWLNGIVDGKAPEETPLCPPSPQNADANWLLAARARLSEDFPGGYELLSTQSTGSLCGVAAVIGSIRQLRLPAPTSADLLHVLRNQIHHIPNKDNTFDANQLNAAIRLWSTECSGFHYILGTTSKTQGIHCHNSLEVRKQDAQGLPIKWIWIHNDDIAAEVKKDCADVGVSVSDEELAGLDPHWFAVKQISAAPVPYDAYLNIDLPTAWDMNYRWRSTPKDRSPPEIIRSLHGVSRTKPFGFPLGTHGDFVKADDVNSLATGQLYTANVVNGLLSHLLRPYPRVLFVPTKKYDEFLSVLSNCHKTGANVPGCTNFHAFDDNLHPSHVVIPVECPTPNDKPYWVVFVATRVEETVWELHLYDSQVDPRRARRTARSSKDNDHFHLVHRMLVTYLA